jgi:hypothetical protein
MEWSVSSRGSAAVVASSSRAPRAGYCTSAAPARCRKGLLFTGRGFSRQVDVKYDGVLVFFLLACCPKVADACLHMLRNRSTPIPTRDWSTTNPHYFLALPKYQCQNASHLRINAHMISSTTRQALTNPSPSPSPNTQAHQTYWQRLDYINTYTLYPLIIPRQHSQNACLNPPHLPPPSPPLRRLRPPLTELNCDTTMQLHRGNVEWKPIRRRDLRWWRRRRNGRS